MPVFHTNANKFTFMIHQCSALLQNGLQGLLLFNMGQHNSIQKTYVSFFKQIIMKEKNNGFDLILSKDQILPNVTHLS